MLFASASNTTRLDTMGSSSAFVGVAVLEELRAEQRGTHKFAVEARDVVGVVYVAAAG